MWTALGGARRAVLVGTAAAATLMPLAGFAIASSPPAGAQALPFPTVPAYGVPLPPAANVHVTPPAVCATKPTGGLCEQAAIYDLDLSRQKVFPKAGPYRLPTNFLQLLPAQQSLILVNLDRAAYGEPTFTGVNDILSSWAAANNPTAPRTDPAPPSASVEGVQWYAYGGNSAAGYPNILFAYQSWVYDDGYGSPNVDCTAPGAAGCWGHRNNVLDNYRVCISPLNPDPTCAAGYFAYLADLSYGAAVGSNVLSQPAYEQLFIGAPSLLPLYSYSWTTAQSSGAGTNDYRVPSTTKLTVSPATAAPGQQVTYSVTVSPAPVTAAQVRWSGAAAGCAAVNANKTTGKATCTWAAPSTPGNYPAGATFKGNQIVAPSTAKAVTLTVK